jgi:hypothetical protein
MWGYAFTSSENIPTERINVIAMCFKCWLCDHFVWDLAQYRIGAVPLDACRNHDHKIDKYRFFRWFLHFSCIIIHKSVWKDELDLLKFIPLRKKARFWHFTIQAPCPVYTGIRYLVWCSNPLFSLTPFLWPFKQPIIGELSQSWK